MLHVNIYILHNQYVLSFIVVYVNVLQVVLATALLVPCACPMPLLHSICCGLMRAHSRVAWSVSMLSWPYMCLSLPVLLINCRVCGMVVGWESGLPRSQPPCPSLETSFCLAHSCAGHCRRKCITDLFPQLHPLHVLGTCWHVSSIGGRTKAHVLFVAE